MNAPSGPNSNSCAADAPCTVERWPVRLNTNRWRFEFIATPATSPKYRPGGSLTGSTFAVNGISGTASWARTAGATATHDRQAMTNRFIRGSSLYDHHG